MLQPWMSNGEMSCRHSLNDVDVGLRTVHMLSWNPLSHLMGLMWKQPSAIELRWSAGSRFDLGSTHSRMRICRAVLV